MLKKPPPRLALTLLLPALLLTACASASLPARPTRGPLIPPLPAPARQPPPPPICAPTCSAALSTTLDSWPPSQTTPASPARPASGPMTP